MSSNARILIAEDNRSLRLDMVELLLMRGHFALGAEDGREALATLAAHHIDLVVSDYEMPNLNGYDLLLALRAHPKHAATPFILMSGGKPPPIDHIAHCRFIKKPFEIDDLMVLIDDMIAQESDGGQRTPD